MEKRRPVVAQQALICELTFQPLIISLLIHASVSSLNSLHMTLFKLWLCLPVRIRTLPCATNQIKQFDLGTCMLHDVVTTRTPIS